MSHSHSETVTRQRVHVTIPGGGTASGVVIDDYGDLMTDKDQPTTVRVDADNVVQLRRYAVSLDDGGLHFTDTIAEHTSTEGADEEGVDDAEPDPAADVGADADSD